MPLDPNNPYRQIGMLHGKTWISQLESGQVDATLDAYRCAYKKLLVDPLERLTYNLGVVLGGEEVCNNPRLKALMQDERVVLEDELAKRLSPSAPTTPSIPALPAQQASSPSPHDAKRTTVFAPLKFHTPSAGSARSLFGRIGSEKSLTGRLFHWMGRGVLQTSYSQAFSAPASSPGESAAKSPEVTKSESAADGKGDPKKDEPKKDDKKK